MTFNPYRCEFHNEQAEQMFLGSLLLSQDAWIDCAESVSPDDFHVAVHQRIYAEITETYRRGGVPTPITLKTRFDGDPDLIDMGGAQYLVDLAACVISLVNAPQFADLIRDLADKRRALEALDLAKEEIESDFDAKAEVCVSEAMSVLERMNVKRETSKFRAKVAEDLINSLCKPREFDPTGIASLDKGMSGGLYRGYTYGLAAREKRGKTTLAHSISYNLNANGVKHAYVALEMGSRQIEERNLARSMGINSLRFLENMGSQELALVTRHAMGMENNTVYVDLPGVTLNELKGELSRLHMRHKIAGFILDYWQLVGGRHKNGTEESHLREVAQWVADFCRKRSMWSIIVAQLNEDNNLFGGRGLRKACDQLYFLEREQNCETAWLRMDSSRYTPLGDVGGPTNPALRFDPRIGPHFRDIND